MYTIMEINDRKRCWEMCVRNIEKIETLESIESDWDDWKCMHFSHCWLKKWHLKNEQTTSFARTYSIIYSHPHRHTQTCSPYFEWVYNNFFTEPETKQNLSIKTTETNIRLTNASSETTAATAATQSKLFLRLDKCKDRKKYLLKNKKRDGINIFIDYVNKKKQTE